MLLRPSGLSRLSTLKKRVCDEPAGRQRIARLICKRQDIVIKLPRYDYDEIIDALEGEEDDAADSDAGEDYELVG